jgi:hypothetical protein
VTVSIAAANPKSLRWVLRSLDLQREHIAEILLVEDWVYEHDHAIARMADEFECRHLRLETPKRNAWDFRVAECRNMGLQHATGDVILWLDDDCVPCFFYLRRLLEIHNEYPNATFNGHRIMHRERAHEWTEKTWVRLVKQWEKRRIAPHRMAAFKSFWDNTRSEFPRSIYGNNHSVRREIALKLPPFTHYFSYGEEDIYWWFKAWKAGVVGLYQPDSSRDLYCCHINHETRGGGGQFSAVNRLWLYEQDAEFRAICQNNTQDWCDPVLERIERDGLQSLEIFEHLLDLPKCLQKYIKR